MKRLSPAICTLRLKTFSLLYSRAAAGTVEGSVILSLITQKGNIRTGNNKRMGIADASIFSDRRDAVMTGQ